MEPDQELPKVETVMPRYKCHKEVWALKIAAIETREDGSATLAFEDPGYAPTIVKDFSLKFKGNEDDLGYYVVYNDGYTSWSPTKAFEEGYTRV